MLKSALGKNSTKRRKLLGSILILWLSLTCRQ